MAAARLDFGMSEPSAERLLGSRRRLAGTWRCSSATIVDVLISLTPRRPPATRRGTRSVMLGAALACAVPGSAAATASTEPVAILSVAGPRSVALVQPVRGNRYLADPCFDSEGRLLTISEEQTASRVERRETASGGVTRLRRLPGAFDAVFGPGCSSIVELRARRNGTDVWMRRADRAPVRIVRTAAFFEVRPKVAWSLDGRRIAVLDRYAGRLLVINTATAKVVRAINGIDNPSLSPQALSPDGAFVTFGGLRDGVARVFVANLRTGATRAVLNDYGDPAFRPDGARLAATSGGLLATFNQDGTGLTPQHIGVAHVGDPIWSPDGAAIAVIFTPRPTSSGEGLGIIRPGLPGLDNRYYKANYALHPARWAPDAQRLAVNGFSLIG